ncbi:MAG: hypothetical protein JW902_06035, partial [Syntrophaceae bacterium]|nr:hypothetical protein [Syntrophaceae bacterium]
FSILNCYYMPYDGSHNLYKEITPVNTFRVIFNHYFGTNYKILEDKSYYSTWSHPFQFIDITEIIGNTGLASFINSRRIFSPNINNENL